MAHAVAFAAIRTTKTREHFAESSYTDSVTAQHKNCPSSGIDDRPGRDLFNLGCWRDRPFLNRTHLVFDEVIPISRQHDRTPSRQHDRTPTVGNTTGSRQHDRTPTKIASALENFPATVIMPSAWPDWSKFQLLRSWHDPAEIRTTRTTTYQTWSERSNH